MANHKVIPYEEIPRRDLEKAAIAIGMIRQSRIDRAAAFGAIRRAAEIARHHDRVCLDALARNKELICERHEENAEAIRRAIRAAIGSSKA